MNAALANDVELLARDLLSRLGLNGSFAVQPIEGGRNNRVYCVRADAITCLLKRYYHHPQDSRDRLGHEWDLLRHLQAVGCRMAARPLLADPDQHAALLEWIEGTRLRLAEVGPKEVDQAIQFYRDANAVRPVPSHFRPASEACFSISEHAATAQRRIDRLSGLVVEDDVDRAAEELARREIVHAWRDVLSAIEREWPAPAERTRALQPAEQCLSPSDFGFHNALREPGGSLRFLDFEYAGRDDPAKLVCDFANQPDMLLSRDLSDRFRHAVIADAPDPAELTRRLVALEPLYQLKWACICLNDFLPGGRDRYQFTDGPAADHRGRRELQLQRARTMFRRAIGDL